MKKLVIIGANNFQLPLIAKAKQLGMQTHVFAWEKGAVGKRIADYFYPISITEKEKILHEIKKINPDGILSIGSDLATITVNYIAEKLGLIGNSAYCTKVTTNKYDMRKCLHNAGLPCPQFTIARNFDDIKNICGEFPLIVKPTDRSGSRGVTKVNNVKELIAAIDRAAFESFTASFIVEQFILGQEYSIEMISWQGEHHFLAITEKETTGEPYFIESGQHQPAKISEELCTKIITLIKAALNSLGMQFGASHSEILVTSNEEVYIVEIGARMGGDYIGSHLVELSTGYDFLHGVINVAMGNFIVPQKQNNLYAGVYFVFAKPGTVKHINNRSAKFTEVIMSEIFFSPGEHVKEAKESNDRAGFYIYQSAIGKLPFDDHILSVITE